MARRDRLHRSELAVPGSNRRMLEKAPRAGADVVFIDLEDAVAPDDKVEARRNAIEAVNDQDWGAAAIAVRINGLDTHWCYRDIVDVVEQAGAKLDILIVPKVGSAADLHLVATLLTQIEAAMDIRRPIGITALVETAIGLARVEDIAQACPDRLEAMVFGVADYAASIQAATTNIGGVSRGYSVLTDADADGAGERHVHWGDPWHYAVARPAVAARAYGVRPIDGPYGDFKDRDGLLASAHRAAALGCEGKWAIHPNQIEAIHAVFTPDEATVTRARRIIDELHDGAGAGAVSLDGRMIDAASIKMAEHLLAKVAQIELRGGESPSPT